MFVNWFRSSNNIIDVSDNADDECEAVISEVIQQEKAWRVEYLGSWWTAHGLESMVLVPGDIVHVVGRKNITLLITSHVQARSN
jgi:membrane protein implicated in regulation of membrane protease activity